MAVLSLCVFIAGGVVSTVQQGWSQGRVEGRELAHGRLKTLAIEYVLLYSSSGLITSGF
jgi:hypothetical protein